MERGREMSELVAVAKKVEEVIEKVETIRRLQDVEKVLRRLAEVMRSG